MKWKRGEWQKGDNSVHLCIFKILCGLCKSLRSLRLMDFYFSKLTTNPPPKWGRLSREGN